jgi:hypothetical protein
LGHNLIDTYLADKASATQISKLINTHMDFYLAKLGIHTTYGENIWNIPVSVLHDIDTNYFLDLTPDPAKTWSIKGGPSNKTICNNESCGLYLKYSVKMNGPWSHVEDHRNRRLGTGVNLIPKNDLESGEYKILVAERSLIDVQSRNISNMKIKTVEYDWIPDQCLVEHDNYNICKKTYEPLKLQCDTYMNASNNAKSKCDANPLCVIKKACDIIKSRYPEGCIPEQIAIEVCKKNDDSKAGVYGINWRYVKSAKHKRGGYLSGLLCNKLITDVDGGWRLHHIVVSEKYCIDNGNGNGNGNTSNCPYFDKDCSHLRNYLSQNAKTYYEDGMFIAATFEYKGDNGTDKPNNLADDVIETRTAE